MTKGERTTWWRQVAAMDDALVARRDLRAHGVTDQYVQAQLAARRWQRVHEGIYATFTGALSWDQRVVAALLYAGGGAYASHTTAAALHGFGAPRLPVQVTIPATRQLDRRPDVEFYRSRRLEPADVIATGACPRTRVERTVVDLVAAARTLDDAFAVAAAAVQARCTTATRLRSAVLARRTLRWRRALLPALDDISEGVHSSLERAWLQVERRHGLPTARRQVPVRRRGGHRWLDCDYDEYGVRAELDGRLGHDQLLERWRDMRRDNDGVVAGHLVLRYGWVDVQMRGCEAAAQLTAVLRSRGWRGIPRKCGPRCVT